MTKIYRKTGTINAEQFDGGQKRVFGYRVIPSSMIDAITGMPAYYSILINDVKPEPDDDFPVDDVEVVFEVGDWIVKEADEIEVIADDVFKQTYAELDERVEEKKYYVKIFDGGLGYLNIDISTGNMTAGSVRETDFFKTKFTDKAIEQLKQRDDIPLDWNKVSFVEAN
ncbi:hypothetical protein [Lactiplantibacillus plantarum]|uniref:hypothetical protein n=1 Tax=Lactiplantibacillus plantarum TaxID=1590 RepID=UPI0015E595E8|nr:hypothetical protein [Lactiplantibacillus plantarum]QLL37359.1 hypothetical protein FEM49_00265 [Lactiplantibacillus plantarum]